MAITRSVISRGHMFLVARLAISAALLWLLFDQFRWDLLYLRFAALDAGWTLGAIAAGGGMAVLTGMRWAILARLAGAPLPGSTTARIFAIGLFFNQTLPTSIGGDAVRVVLAWRAGAPIGPATAGVIVDRVVGLAGLLLLATATLLPLQTYVGGGSAWWGAALLVALGWGGLAVITVFARPVARLLSNRRWAGSIQATAHSVRALFATPRTAALVLFLSIAGHVLTAVMLATLARGFDLAVPVGAILAVMPTLLIVSLAPITLAGWGVREQAAIVAFGAMGLVSADAAALSIAFGVLLAAIGLPGAFLWVAGRTRMHHGNDHSAD